MYQSVKVSAISLKPTKWDKASNAEKLEAFFVEAAAQLKGQGTDILPIRCYIPQIGNAISTATCEQTTIR